MSPVSSIAQTPAAPPTQSSSAAQDDPLRFEMPTVTVTAQKEPEDKQKLPVSVTAVPQDDDRERRHPHRQRGSDLRAEYLFHGVDGEEAEQRPVPRHQLQPEQPGHHDLYRRRPPVQRELLEHRAARRRSDRVRARSAERALRPQHAGRAGEHREQPAVADEVDGHARQSRSATHGSWAVRGGASGPVVSDKVSLGVSFAQVNRDGFTVNDVTGQRYRSPRSRFPPRRQLLWVPNSAWEARVIFTGERARDGDYGLNDVAALRANPFHAARDFEGHADRDVLGTTIQARRVGGPVVFSSTTGFLNWKTQDVTDLDYTRSPILTRDNTEKDFQFTRRFASPRRTTAPVQLSDSARLRWQAGVFSLHAGLSAGRHQHLCAVRCSRQFRSASTRRCPSSTTSVWACSVRARSRSTTGWT